MMSAQVSGPRARMKTRDSDSLQQEFKIVAVDVETLVEPGEDFVDILDLEPAAPLRRRVPRSVDGRGPRRRDMRVGMAGEAMEDQPQRDQRRRVQSHRRKGVEEIRPPFCCVAMTVISATAPPGGCRQ